jgi:hypothetical protein
MVLYGYENVSMICTYLNSHHLGVPREYVLHGLDPGLDWASFWPSTPHAFHVATPRSVSWCLSQRDWVSHLSQSLLSRWLLTNVQVNNTTTLYDTHGHEYIHHIGNTILLSSFLLFFLNFFHLSWQAGWFRPFRSDTVMVTRKCIITRYIIKITVAIIQKELQNIFKIKISCFYGIRKHIFLNKSHLTEQKWNFVTSFT